MIDPFKEENELLRTASGFVERELAKTPFTLMEKARSGEIIACCMNLFSDEQTNFVLAVANEVGDVELAADVEARRCDHHNTVTSFFPASLVLKHLHLIGPSAWILEKRLRGRLDSGEGFVCLMVGEVFRGTLRIPFPKSLPFPSIN